MPYNKWHFNSTNITRSKLSQRLRGSNKRLNDNQEILIVNYVVLIVAMPQLAKFYPLLYFIAIDFREAQNFSQINMWKLLQEFIFWVELKCFTKIIPYSLGSRKVINIFPNESTSPDQLIGMSHSKIAKSIYVRVLRK